MTSRKVARHGGCAQRIFEELRASGFRVKMDDREEVTVGFKFNDWEMRGVPLRIRNRAKGPGEVQRGVGSPQRAVAKRTAPSFPRQGW